MNDSASRANAPPDTAAESRKRRSARFAVIGKHIRKYKTPLLWGGLSVTLSAGMYVVRPYIIKILLDRMEAGTLENYGLGLAGAMLGLTALGGVFSFINRRTVIWTSRKIEYDLRGELFAKLLRLPMSFYHQHRVGDIMARLTNDVEAVRMMFGPAIMYFANTIVSTILAVGIMLYMAPKLTLYILIPMPFISYLVTSVGGVIHKRFAAIQTQFSVLTAAAQENLSGIRVIKAYSQELGAINSFAKHGRDYVDCNMSLARFNGVFHPMLFGMTGLITLIALYFGGQAVIAGEITKGTLVSFFVYVAMLLWPIIALGWAVSLYQRGTASLDRITSILQEIDEYETKLQQATASRTASKTARKEMTGKIEFRNLTFSYQSQGNNGRAPHESQFQLRNISLTIQAGESIGIIGPVASGKSTLAALLPRLYNPPRGSLFIDNTDILDWQLDDLRQQIGFVPQESFLFSETLDENIRLGAPGARPDEVAQVAAIAALEGEIEEFSDGYATIIGERGVTLSGGQRQRVSIARAALIDPKIMVLDDATSAVDTETDAKIARELQIALRGRTSLIISHRISTVKNCSRIIYLDSGEITELGTHDELLAAGGAYAELNRMQSLQQELVAN